MQKKMFARSSFAMRLFLLLGGFLSVSGQRLYTIVNKCPDPIYIEGGESWATWLSPNGGSVTRDTGPNTDFYASTNGNQDGATRVGFYSGITNQYFIVKHWDSFNIGVRVKPSYPEGKGFCPHITCDAVTCTTAFVDYPRLDGPDNPNTLPKPPLYGCPSLNPSFIIIFCPSGTFPGDNGRAAAIHPNGNPKKCVDVRGAVYSNGTPVQIYDCNGTGAQKWVYTKGSTKIRVANRNFCLDSSNPPTRDGVGMKIWQCYDKLPAQEWFVDSTTSDIQPIRDGTGYCLDLPNGVLTNWNQLQAWGCANGNKNQLWNKGLF